MRAPFLRGRKGRVERWGHWLPVPLFLQSINIMKKSTMLRTICAALCVLMATPADAAPTRCLPAKIKSALKSLKRFGKIQIISTYRPGARIAGTRRRSKHASCRAVDFHIRGNRRAALRWLRKQRLEVITYGCAMHHIHIAPGSYRGHHCVDRYGRRRR